jgi:iron complex transport system substrate-binding protein
VGVRSLWIAMVVLAVACSRGDRAAPTQTRLITLTPSATAIVTALGATALLVGVDDYSKEPAEVGKLPKVGSFLTPNLEAIVALKPSLVIVDDIHAAASGALHDAGLATIECPMHALPDVKRALRRLGDAIGKADTATTVIQGIDAALDAAAARRPARHPRVLAIIDREDGGLGNLVAAGPGSWLDELLAVVGGDNVLAAAGVRYPKISTEEVLRAKPDVILDLSYAAHGDVTAWAAAKGNARVVVLTDQALIAPSPRVADALATLGHAIHETTAP